VLRKTKHIILLSTPQEDLTWQLWQQITRRTSNAASRGQWKLWSAAHRSSTKAFPEIAPYINVTYANAEDEGFSRDPDSDVCSISTISHHLLTRQFAQARRTAHHICITCEGVDHVSISKLARESNTYKKLLTRIRESVSSIMIKPDDVNRIRSWLGRRLDDVNVDSHQRNLSRHHPGTGEWLFEDIRFRDWVSSNKPFPVLWLVGPGGCGKSILCSVVAERMRQNVQQQAVVYLMLAFDKPRSQYYLVTQIALQLLEYVVMHRDGVDVETLLMLPAEYDKDKKTTQVCELVKVLISQCPSVYVFVDGLDEVGMIEEPELRSHAYTRPEILKQQVYAVLSFLAGLTSKNEGTQVRLWCSSKQTSVIDEWMRKMVTVELPVNRIAGAVDIAHYLEHRLGNLTKNLSSAPHNAGVLTDLCKMAKNNFLLASTMADTMISSDLFGTSAFKVSMHDSPTEISEVYRRELDRMVHLDSSSKLHIQGGTSSAL
jgi:hypothetical protein